MSEARYGSLADRAAQAGGVPAPLFRRVIGAESAWNPRAGSSAGAQGLGQLMPGTARELGVTDVYNPRQNLFAAARYLGQQYRTFGTFKRQGIGGHTDHVDITR